MIAAFLICLVIILTVVEIVSLTVDPDKVFFRCEADMELTEPDETATIYYRVSNTAKWPLMFVSFSFTFNDAVTIRESEEWRRRHDSGSFLNNSYSFDTFLLPGRTYKGSIRLSVSKRGKYDLGKAYIETGDFLGFKSKVKSFSLGHNIICTARTLDDGPETEALGGEMGEISVRRFIMEDPSLVLGYREYTGAEPLKHISWVQTAKTGRLTVKKHDFTVDNDVAVFVDIEHTEKETAERCLSLVRTACSMLEEARIPYALHSNGDLFEMEKGVGKVHLFEIERRIGLSRFVRFRSFASLADRRIRGGCGRTGCILIAPEMTPETESLIRLVSESSGAPTCVLLGKEDPA